MVCEVLSCFNYVQEIRGLRGFIYCAVALRSVMIREKKNRKIYADNDVGVVGAELRDKQWSKILSLAPMHV